MPNPSVSPYASQPLQVAGTIKSSINEDDDKISRASVNAAKITYSDLKRKEGHSAVVQEGGEEPIDRAALDPETEITTQDKRRKILSAWMNAYHAEHFHDKDKARGLYEEKLKPSWWPKYIPYASPNNAPKKNKSENSKKLRAKDLKVLIPIVRKHLIKKLSSEVTDLDENTMRVPLESLTSVSQHEEAIATREYLVMSQGGHQTMAPSVAQATSTSSFADAQLVTGMQLPVFQDQDYRSSFMQGAGVDYQQSRTFSAVEESNHGASSSMSIPKTVTVINETMENTEPPNQIVTSRVEVVENNVASMLTMPSHTPVAFQDYNPIQAKGEGTIMIESSSSDLPDTMPFVGEVLLKLESSPSSEVTLQNTQSASDYTQIDGGNQFAVDYAQQQGYSENQPTDQAAMPSQPSENTGMTSLGISPASGFMPAQVSTTGNIGMYMTLRDGGHVPMPQDYMECFYEQSGTAHAQFYASEVMDTDDPFDNSLQF